MIIENRMIESFVISILANLATEGGKIALNKILKSDELETQISQAFDSALNKWTVNTGIKDKEKIWTTKRLNQLLNYLKNPETEKQFEVSTQKLIEYFYLEIQKHETAWHFIQGEHFKTEISKLNSIESHLQKLIDDLKENRLTTDFVVAKLKEHTENQLQKQIATEKYIPKTFIETDELKDYLRYFLYSNFFLPMVQEEASNLDFRHLNRKNSINKKRSFDYCFEAKNVDDAITYLKQKHEELEGFYSNVSYAFTRKIKDCLNSFEYFKYQSLLLTDNAGQGKTNLLCDIVQNLILKREIPTFFLTGYEINSDNIGASIASKILPNDTFTLGEILEALDNYRREDESPILFIIDGINENSNPKEFSNKLESFLESILGNKRIKVLLTCRTEYFENNFKNLLKSSFESKIKHIDGLNNKLDEIHKEQLINAYFHHFNIRIESIRKGVRKQLEDNFLLLRIFSEVNRGKQIISLDNIFKTDLFIQYYKAKVAEINKRLKDNDDFNIKGNIDIKSFIELIASYMINSGEFHNIPIQELIREDCHREIYMRFLDENIILKKDITTNDSIFENSEVVNFTYDEFRDFIIADFLVNKVYPSSVEKFVEFLECNFNEKSPILEGVPLFLYSLCRKNTKAGILDIVKEQPWFDTAFIKVIFNLVDEEITQEDKELIKEFFFKNSKISKRVILELAYNRYDVDSYKNLNINFLFEIFDSLTDEQFEAYVYVLYNEYGNGVEQLVDQLETFLEDFKESYHKLFKYLLYLLPLSYKARSLYIKYFRLYHSINHIKDVLTCNSKNVISNVNKICEYYDIQP
jgi:hypothetical protein